jgi:hypothetical protein
MTRTITKSSVILTLALSLATLATAQNDAARNLYVSAANVPTNITGIHTYAEAPKGFNPVAASDVDLATYGFPPRPDKQADPDHYALWERAMLAARIRANGELKPMPARTHEMMPARSSSSAQAVQPQAGPLRVSTVNWSGVVVQNTLKTWNSKTSFDDVYTVISVPTSQIPFGSGSCFASGAAYMSEFSFAGIDGYNPYTVQNGELQGGVGSTFFCTAGYPTYFAFVGWGNPYYEVFSVNPGDIFYTEIHAFAPPNPAQVYVEDVTTLTYNSYTVDPDPLVPLVGRTAEWVVERDCCQGPNPSPLLNTVGIFFDEAGALNGNGKLFYPGSTATSTAILSMTDDGATQNIEVVNQGSSGYQGQHSLWFQTTGCAFAGGCDQ